MHFVGNVSKERVEFPRSSLCRKRPEIRLHVTRGTEQSLVQLKTILNNVSRNRRPAL